MAFLTVSQRHTGIVFDFLVFDRTERRCGMVVGDLRSNLLGGRAEVTLDGVRGSLCFGTDDVRFPFVAPSVKRHQKPCQLRLDAESQYPDGLLYTERKWMLHRGEPVTHLVLAGRTYDIYTAPRGRSGVRFPIWAQNEQKALVIKMPATSDDLEQYKVYAVSEEECRLALYLAVYLDMSRYAHDGKPGQRGVERVGEDSVHPSVVPFDNLVFERQVEPL